MDISRIVTNMLCDDLSADLITILIGARQVGKSYLLRKVENFAKTKGLKTAFFDLEQPGDLAKFNGTDSDIIEFIARSGEVVFIDEFHYIENISHIFKAIYDSDRKIKIYASGSSSLEIHKHLKESLAGRKLIYNIYPCSISEIGQVVKDDPFLYFCRFGGMPGLIHSRDESKKILLLNDIVQSYLLKDIKSLIKEENIRAFNKLLFLLSQYQGSIVSVSNLSNEIGMTSRTIESYLEIMAQTYVCFPLYSFSKNYGNELKKSKKYYLYDLGIRNAVLKNFDPLQNRKDSGIIVESFVFGELQKKISPETEIRFWRLKSGEEIDFIWIKNQKPYPIEVKSAIGAGDIPQGIKSFLNRYPDTSKAFVLNRASEGETNFNKTKIIYKKWIDSGTIPDLV